MFSCLTGWHEFAKLIHDLLYVNPLKTFRLHERMVIAMKKITLIIVIAFVVLLALSSCGGMSSNDMKSSFPEGSDFGAGEYERNEMSDSLKNGLIFAENTQHLAENKKIIRNASLDVEAEDSKDTYDLIISWAIENGGYEFNKNLYTHSEYSVIDAEIRIHPANLDAFIVFIGECGDVINCNVSAKDITAQYFDVDLRLKSKRASLESYYRLLAGAVNVDEILAVQRIIDEITSEIESAEGQLKMWDSQVSESVVTLHINEKRDPVKVRKNIDWTAMPFKDMGWNMRNGFISVSNGAFAVVQWVLILLVSISPLIVIAGIITVIIIVVRKKRKK